MARNEVLFGTVNEQVAELRDRLLTHEKTLSIVCECGHEDCGERVTVAAAEYQRVREQPAWFALVPAHVIPDLEDVIEEHDGWVVVEKREPVKSVLEARA